MVPDLTTREAPIVDDSLLQKYKEIFSKTHVKTHTYIIDNPTLIILFTHMVFIDVV